MSESFWVMHLSLHHMTKPGVPAPQQAPWQDISKKKKKTAYVLAGRMSEMSSARDL